MLLWFRYISMHVKSQLQYRLSTLFIALGQSLVVIPTFFGLYLMYERFGNLNGWSYYEAALCYSVTYCAYYVSEMVMRGFDSFSNSIINGGFDRVLLRPRNLILQVMGSQFDLSRLGRLLPSVFFLLTSVRGLDIVWTPYKVFVLILSVLSGILIFSGVIVLFSTLSFWTIDRLEIANLFTDGGREAAKYPITIYNKYVTLFFTFVIPFAVMNYIPLEYILGKNLDFFASLAPLIGAAFFMLCCFFWFFGVRHYKSTGS